MGGGGEGGEVKTVAPKVWDWIPKNSVLLQPYLVKAAVLDNSIYVKHLLQVFAEAIKTFATDMVDAAATPDPLDPVQWVVIDASCIYSVDIPSAPTVGIYHFLSAKNVSALQVDIALT